MVSRFLNLVRQAASPLDDVATMARIAMQRQRVLKDLRGRTADALTKDLTSSLTKRIRKVPIADLRIGELISEAGIGLDQVPGQLVEDIGEERRRARIVEREFDLRLASNRQSLRRAPCQQSGRAPNERPGVAQHGPDETDPGQHDRGPQHRKRYSQRRGQRPERDGSQQAMSR